MDDIRLTIDELRRFDFCKELNDEQVGKLADFLAEYSVIVYKVLGHHEENRG